MAFAISLHIRSFTKFEISLLSIASFTETMPDKNATPQVNEWVPFNKRNFNSLNRFISCVITTPLSASAKDNTPAIFSSPSIAHKLYTSLIVIKSSL